jgi:uncharacterized protein (TIGR02266 family)
MSNETFTNNRKHFRIPFHTKFIYGTQERVFTGTSLNLSPGGVFIATMELIPRGSLCRVSFLLKDNEEPIMTEALVRRVSSAGFDPQEIAGLGFQFTDDQQNVEVAARITDFIEQSRRQLELVATILSSGEPELLSLLPLFRNLHLPPFTDLGEVRQHVERVLKSIELVEKANEGISE